MRVSASTRPRNRFAARCYLCGAHVPPAGGRLVGRDDAADRWNVACPDCLGEARPAPPPRPLPDCFSRLGLGRPVDELDVRARFRQLAMECHPDHGGSAARFVELRRDLERALSFLKNESR